MAVTMIGAAGTGLVRAERKVIDMADGRTI
jgi:hypothetical protein